MSSDDGTESFNCAKCFGSFSASKGVVIKECSHRFCKPCLVGHCKYSATKYTSVRCPRQSCNCEFTEGEIRNLLGDKYSEYSLKILERLSAGRKKKDRDDSDETRPAKGEIEKSSNNKRNVDTDRQKNRHASDEALSETFTCLECDQSTNKKRRYIVEGCMHIFCDTCFRNHCMYSASRVAAVECPKPLCKNIVTDDKIETWLGNNYGRYAAKKLEFLRATQKEVNEAGHQSRMGTKGDARKDSGKDGKFNCSKCRRATAQHDGFKVNRCQHGFCKKCLINHSMNSAAKYNELRCPEQYCTNIVDDDEIKKLLGPKYLEYTSKQEAKKEAVADGSKYKEYERESDNFIRRPHDNHGETSDQSFNCFKCGKSTAKRDGLKIERCFHNFCVKCFTINCILGLSRESKVECPFMYCKNLMNEDEIKKLLGDSCDEEQFKELRMHRRKDDGGAVGFDDGNNVRREQFEGFCIENQDGSSCGNY